jgi:CHC2 zinc finger
LISTATVARLRAAVALRGVVEEQVRMDRSGVGLCPFHADKTPSFRVYPDGHFYCFGCQLSGDVITFLMKTQALTFTQACEQLSERSGIPLQDDRPYDAKAEQRARALAEQTAKMAVWYWREQRIIATRKRSEPMLLWINRLTPKEMLMIWMAERTPALEALYHQDQRLTEALCNLFRENPDALDALDLVVARMDQR